MLSLVPASAWSRNAARCGGLPGGGVPSGTASASSAARVTMSWTEPSGVAAGDTMAIGSFCTAPSSVIRRSRSSAPRSTMRAGRVGVATQPSVAPVGSACGERLERGKPGAAVNVADRDARGGQMAGEERGEGARQGIHRRAGLGADQEGDGCPRAGWTREHQRRGTSQEQPATDHERATGTGAGAEQPRGAGDFRPGTTG